jgi:hypothetical protein
VFGRELVGGCLFFLGDWMLTRYRRLGFTSTRGGQQPLIAWETLSAAARTALTNTDFGSANVPFKDGNFMSNLAKAYPL